MIDRGGIATTDEMHNLAVQIDDELSKEGWGIEPIMLVMRSCEFDGRGMLECEMIPGWQLAVSITTDLGQCVATVDELWREFYQGGKPLEENGCAIAGVVLAFEAHEITGEEHDAMPSVAPGEHPSRRTVRYVWVAGIDASTMFIRHVQGETSTTMHGGVVEGGLARVVACMIERLHGCISPHQVPAGGSPGGGCQAPVTER